MCLNDFDLGLQYSASLSRTFCRSSLSASSANTKCSYTSCTWTPAQCGMIAVSVAFGFPDTPLSNRSRHVVAMNKMSLRGLHLSSLASEVNETDSPRQPLSLANVGPAHYLATLVLCTLPPTVLSHIMRTDRASFTVARSFT